jgi:UDP-N-acetylglucosamine--dolichyl-phosphate N-acetylglucosaminephosphotransferase
MSLEILVAALSIFFAFLACVGLTRWWISVAKRNNLVGKDMNKYSKNLVAESGGIAVVISIVLAIMMYIFFKTFIIKTETHILEISILTITLLLACTIGFIDDILGWKKGLKPWQKVLMTLVIAIPLVVINAGHSIISLPFIGAVDLGLFYPLLIVPLGVIGATNGYNLLAGHNGLEAGLGAVIFMTLGIVLFMTGQMWLAFVAAIIVLALFAFLIFNKLPAKVFPGDSLTYSAGAMIVFIPFIIEGILKAGSRFKAENFGIPKKDGSLELPYKKTYSLTHFSMKLLRKIKPSHKVYEKDVVALLVSIEAIIGIAIILTI